MPENHDNNFTDNSSKVTEVHLVYFINLNKQITNINSQW